VKEEASWMRIYVDVVLRQVLWGLGLVLVTLMVAGVEWVFGPWPMRERGHRERQRRM
jgi:hypothetical protein